MKWYALILVGLSVVVLTADEYVQAQNVHAPFDSLLKKYVKNGLIRYEAFSQNKKDLAVLAAYLEELQRMTPSSMPRNRALAFWINLYNAATLKLVLDHYPVKSIKDIGGFFSSPWKRKLVEVEGKRLTLDQIENEIIRPQFGDARIHFVLNCAALGCPPMQPFAYTGDELEQQLELATRSALASPGWLRVREDAVWVTKLFDWYRSDFVADAGSVRAYLARFAPDSLRQKILDEKRPIRMMDYDWALNKAD